MAEQQQKLADRWNDYRPTKTVLFWACAACVALTLIVGFSWGGWVTASTARDMVEDATETGRAQLAATVCVEQFLEGTDARAQLAALKESDLWNRDSFITDGGWATLPGMKEPVDEAANICAQRLAELEIPAKEAATNAAGTTVQ